MSSPVTTIAEIGKHEGQAVTIRGWLYNLRESGKLLFPQFRDGSGIIQGVVPKNAVSPEVFDAIKTLTQESSVIVEGKVRADKRAHGGYELDVANVQVVQRVPESSPYPITPKEHGTDFLMEHRHLWVRGHPERLWHPLVMWNPHSVMFEVAWCVTLYSTVLFLEFIPVVFEKFGWHKPMVWIHKISVPLMILGVLLSTLHQSSLGTLFLIVPEKLYPLWYTPCCRCCFTFRRSGGAGHDHFRIVAQQPGLWPRAGTAAAGQHGAGIGGANERLSVDPLPGHDASRRLRPADAQPD